MTNPTDNLFAEGEGAPPVPVACTGCAPPAQRVELIRPTPHLPATAAGYLKARRVAADPIGKGGLPADREDLNAALLGLCNRLAAAGGAEVSAARLVEEIGLLSDRELRLLMAYGRVHHRIRWLVGLEGGGYCWGELAPEVMRHAAAVARRKGVCSLFNAALYSRQPVAVEVAQLALEFRSDPDARPGESADELTAWLASEKITPGQLVEAWVDVFASTPEGLAALRNAARSRPGIFLDKEAAEALRKNVQGVLDALDSAKRAG